MLPTDAQERKNVPIYTGFMVYFMLAIIEVTKISVRGNEQHNPGSDLHWDRGKSKDERDSQARHLLDQAAPLLSLDDEITHAAAGAWRAMANLQKLCERRDGILDSRTAIENLNLKEFAVTESQAKFYWELNDSEKAAYITRLNEESRHQNLISRH